MLKIEELQEQLSKYVDEVKLYFHAFGVGDILLDKPIDHVAIKAKDRTEYEGMLAEYLPHSKRLSYEQVGERDLAIAELYEPLDCGNFGTVSTIEIMEPKPNAIVTTQDMVDHIELITEDFEAIRERLQQAGIRCIDQANENHKAIIVEINEFLQEVKFTNTSLVAIAEKQLLAGKAQLVI